MNLSNKQYSELAKDAEAPSKAWLNVPKAFVIGGIICMIGQGIGDFYTWLGMTEDERAAFTSLTLVLCSVILTGFGLYPKVAKHGGAGTLVPITGFANAVASPAIEFRTEGWILGVGTKIFTIAGPVILYGTAAGVVYGVIYFICTRVF